MQRCLIRVLDLCFSLVAIIAFFPIFILILLAIYFTMGGPAIFAQTRLGIDGKPFTVFKFRSMENREIAEHEFEKVNEFAVKLKNDPRITPIGSFLRKTSLDELPQLFNVLKGDMSFVGPRPWVPDEYDVIPKEWHSRLQARPGITGFAQISGRSDLAMEKIVERDMQWVKHQSIPHYFRVLFKTVKYALKMNNVY